jgi:hypothetical protein
MDIYLVGDRGHPGSRDVRDGACAYHSSMANLILLALLSLETEFDDDDEGCRCKRSPGDSFGIPPERSNASSGIDGERDGDGEGEQRMSEIVRCLRMPLFRTWSLLGFLACLVHVLLSRPSLSSIGAFVTPLGGTATGSQAV